MQVFKKICALALAGLLIGCRSTSVTTDSGIYDSISDIDEAAFEAPSSFRVGRTAAAFRRRRPLRTGSETGCVDGA